MEVVEHDYELATVGGLVEECVDGFEELVLFGFWVGGCEVL